MSAKKWRVTGHVTISISTVVEAATAAQAKRIAAERTIAQVHIPSNSDENAEWVAGEELDGEPEVVAVEEEDGR